MWPDRFDMRRAPWRPASSAGDLPAAAAVVVVLVQLALAQLTLVLVLCLLAVNRLGRWHPLWLAWPAAAGVIWALSLGVRPSIAGYAAVGAALARHLAAGGPLVHRLASLPVLLSDWRDWLASQLPLALLAAPAQVLVVAQLRRVSAPKDEASQARPGGPRRPAADYRSGLLVLARRGYLVMAFRRGELATWDGACVGLAPRTARRVSISWQEAQGGVLCTGQDAETVTRTALALAIAAIAHRKSVLVVDLASLGGGPAGRSVSISGGPAGRLILPAERGDSAGLLRSRIVLACSQYGAPLRFMEGARGFGKLPAMIPDAYTPLTGAAVRPNGDWPPHALTGRGVVVHSLGRPDRDTAELAVAGLTRILGDHSPLLGPTDCLVWVNGCEAIESDQLARLANLGATAGAVVVLSTTDGTLAADLTTRLNVTLVRDGPPDAQLASPYSIEPDSLGRDCFDRDSRGSDSLGRDSLGPDSFDSGMCDLGMLEPGMLLVLVRRPGSRAEIARAAW
jgi:hypothetical protein